MNVRDPELHIAARRLLARDLADAARVIADAPVRSWIREAARAYLATGTEQLERLGVYTLPNAQGEPIPMLMVDVAVPARSKYLPARAAIVGLTADCQVSTWIRDPARWPGETPIRGQHLG